MWLTFGILPIGYLIRNTLNWSDRVEFGKSWAVIAAKMKSAESLAAPPAWSSLLAPIRAWNPRLRLAAAGAALVCIVGVAWAVVTNVTMRSTLERLEAESLDLSQREASVRRELGEEQNRSRSLLGEIQKQRSGITSGLAASLILVPGVSRTEAVRQEFVLSASAQLVHTEIQLESRDDYFRFRVELRTRSGVEILTRGDLVRRRTATGTVVAFDVPADALAPGEYELMVKGVPSGRAVEEIGSYYISVQRP